MNDQTSFYELEHNDHNPGIQIMINPVTNHMRKRNKLAMDQRTAWRIKYNTLALSIREHKEQVRVNPTCYRSKIELEGLQTLAHIMMAERCMITFDLRDSAYKWV